MSSSCAAHLSGHPLPPCVQMGLLQPPRAAPSSALSWQPLSLLIYHLGRGRSARSEFQVLTVYIEKRKCKYKMAGAENRPQPRSGRLGGDCVGTPGRALEHAHSFSRYPEREHILKKAEPQDEELHHQVYLVTKRANANHAHAVGARRLHDKQELAIYFRSCSRSSDIATCREERGEASERVFKTGLPSLG